MACTGKHHVNFHRFPLPSPSGLVDCDALDVLRRRFGHDSFRGIQQDVIDTALSGIDTLGLMPTGGGKSLCFQIPAMVTGKTTLVISPLVALMRDQVDGLRRLGIRAAALPGGGSLGHSERLQIESAALAGSLELLYVSPERLANPTFVGFLAGCGIGLVAIDEAHSVCEWGHDFRPDYLEIADRLAVLGDVPRMALTASAGTQARKEIASRLLRADHRIFSTGFDRPNILLAADRTKEPRSRLLAILKARRALGAALVYTRSRDGAVEVSDWLRRNGIVAEYYHAGMDGTARSAVQDDFLAGALQTLVATSAFGMGIDKRDIATVCHLGLPQGIESYYQEIGRAGRDGRESVAWLAWAPSEAGMRLRKAAAGDNPSAMRREIARVESMLAYVENPSCRRTALLAKFGSATPGTCGKCDVCLSDTPLDALAAPLVAAVMDEISMRPGDYTMMTLAETLLGFPSPDLPPATEIAGKMAGQEEAGVRRFLRQLLGAGVMELDDRYATVKLTDVGSDRLMSGSPVLLPTTAVPIVPLRTERKGRGLPPRLARQWEDLLGRRRSVAERLGVRESAVASDEDLTSFMANGRVPDGVRPEFREILEGSPREIQERPAGQAYDTGLF